jgi:hypothetical protein
MRHALCALRLKTQPVAKIGVASLSLIIVHRNGQRLFGTNQHNQFSAPGHSGVDQIALEEDVVLRQDGKYYRRVF